MTYIPTSARKIRASLTSTVLGLHCLLPSLMENFAVHGSKLANRVKSVKCR